MGLGLPDGGHLTHGYYTAKKKMTASSIYFQSFPYATAPGTGLVDYAGLDAQAKIFKPRLIICGASAYPRDWDYGALKKTAEREGAWLMADIAHTSGLIAAQELNNPFEFCDVVTTTTHKTLRGPRAGLIFFRKDLENAQDLEKRVNEAVFPACQGGPHNNVSCLVLPYFQIFKTTCGLIDRPSRPLLPPCSKLLSPRSRRTRSRSSSMHVLWPQSSLRMGTSSNPTAPITISFSGTCDP